MSIKVNDLEPESLWCIFDQICKIPHPSKNKLRIVEFVTGFAREYGLEVKKDAAENVLIRKPATPGMENKKTVVLQSHLDMVPQKNNDTVHDFNKDPIDAYVDGDWVKAKGTTLGADNGIGVAASLAVLIEKEIKHGAIECLFTVDEETGMTGAFALEPGFVNGDILLNLDSEEEGELYIGCAGGINTNAFFDYNKENVSGDYKFFKLEVKGLKGGHSGLDIHTGRGNAIKILIRLLWDGIKNYELRIASVDGGSLRNAIPREAEAIIALPFKKEQDFAERVKEMIENIENEFKGVDDDIKINFSYYDKVLNVIDEQTSKKMIKAVYACPNGTIRMAPEMENVVETSTNLAVLKSENGKIEAATLQRSFTDSAKEDLCNMVRAVFELAGAKVIHSGEYPGWEPNVNSHILKIMEETYKNMYGKTPEVKVIHAGLECGLIGNIYPNLDMISFGPTIKNPHSPGEMVNIPSVKKFYEYLIRTLENV